MKVYWSDITYPHDEAREVRLFTRKRDRDAYVAAEMALYYDVSASCHEWTADAHNSKYGCSAVFLSSDEN